MIRTQTISLLLLLASTTVTVSTHAVETVRPLTIVAFGDSTTATRSTVKQVYADRLPVLLAASGIEAEVINAGTGGSHTGRLTDNARHKRQHALDRLNNAVRDHKPDIVIIQFGWNDSWVDSNSPDDPSRIPLDKYSDNLAYIVSTLTKDGARVILMTPNRPNTSMDSWRIKRTQLYVTAVRKLSKSASIPLIDIWQEYEQIEATEKKSSDEFLLDSVHPNDKGHTLVANLLSQEIAKSLLRDTLKSNGKKKGK